ncbi:MAG: metallophosphoesterase family protein [Desulfobacterales bacterium]|nr:metallophosphoesterase family protein [Desulfobacterales bacterium]
MRLAVISDIHGNLDAFRRVLEDMDRSMVDAVVCLGDAIGYGPEPDQVVSLIDDLKVPAIIGNHELAAIEPACLREFNPPARASIEMTMGMLSERSLHFIRALQPYHIGWKCHFVHGFPPDSIDTYLHGVSKERLESAFHLLDQKICFAGHTHLLEIIGFDGRQVIHAPLPQGVVGLERPLKYIINAGSVGQPRDADKRAKYVIWDDAAYTIEARFVSYDIWAVYHKILQAGLPRVHADRLIFRG